MGHQEEKKLRGILKKEKWDFNEVEKLIRERGEEEEVKRYTGQGGIMGQTEDMNGETDKGGCKKEKEDRERTKKVE